MSVMDRPREEELPKLFQTQNGISKLQVQNIELQDFIYSWVLLCFALWLVLDSSHLKEEGIKLLFDLQLPTINRTDIFF